MVYAMGSGNAVAVPVKKKGGTVAKKPGGTVARKPIPAPRQPSKAVALREGGVNPASKAYKAGRLIRVGGGPVLAATAAWEIAQAGKRNIAAKKEQGYDYTGAEHSGYGGMARPKFEKSVQNAAQRRTTTLDERRAERMKHKVYQGEHYGPDEFKGDMKMLKAYRSAGSPKDKTEFAKDFKKKYGTGKGWQGTQNRGQGAGDQWRKEVKTPGARVSGKPKAPSVAAQRARDRQGR